MLRVKATFSKFIAIWGQKWLKPLEDERSYQYAIKEWGETLQGLKDEQIRNAIDKCKVLYNFPPSISEFLEAALDIPALGYCQDKNNCSQNFFCKILWSRIDSWAYKNMTSAESRFYIKEQYDALREEFLCTKSNQSVH